MDIFNTTKGAVTLGSLVRDIVSSLWVGRAAADRDQSLLTCQIKLEMAKLRLMTWAQALIAGGGDLAVELENLQPGLADALTMLLALVRSAEERSNNNAQQQQQQQQQTAPTQRLTSAATSDLEIASQRIAAQLSQIWQTIRGRVGSAVQTANWVLYDRESLNELVNCITEVVKQLETSYPACVSAASAGLEAIAIVNPNGLANPRGTIQLLEGAAAGVYPELVGVARKQTMQGDSIIFSKPVKAEGKGSRHMFGKYNESMPERGAPPTNVEFKDTVTASGENSITYAGIINGKGPFASQASRSRKRRAARHRA
jgi:hypothetical protein